MLSQTQDNKVNNSTNTGKNSNFSAEQKRILNQINSNSDLIIVCPYANQAQYYCQAAFGSDSDLTIVVLPSNSAVQREINHLKTTEIYNHTAYLTSDLFPNQARHLLAEIADGHYKLLLVTPESFLYWFSSGFNSLAVEHYRKMEENDLGKQVFANAQRTMERIDRVVFCEFELFSRTNAIFKEKYQEAINLIKELEKPILGLSYNCSKETIQHFMRFFPSTAVIQESFQLSGVSLKTKYCFSKLDKQKHLAKLLEDNKPTLIYTSPNENLGELISYLSDKLPNKVIRALHKDLQAEHRAESLDYFLTDPCPTFIASSCLMEGVERPDIYRLIHYSPPKSLAEFYKDIHILKPKQKLTMSSSTYRESHMIICEDDLNPSLKEKEATQIQFSRDGLQVDYKKLTKQLLEWFSQNKGCRWQNLEKVLTSNLQEHNQCGICDLCTGEKFSLFSTMSMFMLKGKFN